MPDRAELEQFWQRWLDTNRVCETERNWQPLAEFFAPDATYGWNCGPDDTFMAVGRDQIREFALDLEMRGLDGWTYPYQATLIDERAGMIVGFWKQVADAADPAGRRYEIAGLGASWFRYRDGQWMWQRDFFDHMNAGATFLSMLKHGVLSPGMTERMTQAASGQLAPGHFRLADTPASLWPEVG
jgi:hypothetical protein